MRALRTQQGGDVDVFSFFLHGTDVPRVADISRVYRDDEDSLKGFQRKEIRRHVNGIVEYLEQGTVLFPNAIILALSPEIEFRQSRGPAPEGVTEVARIGCLHIPIRSEGKRVAWVVDGQQRFLALSKSNNNNIAVPIVGFVAPDLETQREQFILVNKAKPLPVRLINELLPEIGTDLPSDLSPRKIPSELCNLLNSDPKSPFFKLIRRASSEPGDKSAVVTDTALINVMKHSIGNFGILSFYKGAGRSGSDVDEMYRIMCLYWSAVRDVFPYAWGHPPSESRLMHSAGIQAMGVLMDRMMPRTQKAPNPQQATRSALQRIAPHCHWTEGVWEGLDLRWDQVQSVPRHIRGLAEFLVQVDFAESQEAA